MKILVALTYYRPHVSGLTIYVERLSRALAARGHAVTVLTSRYDSTLLPEEKTDGVHIVRAPVIARVSKGVIMPTLSYLATKFVWQNDVLSLHLPQLDASGIATRAKILNKPSVLTYHSDLLLPFTPLNFLAGNIVEASNHVAAMLCDSISAYTDDFARHSRYLSKYLDKVRVMAPPVEIHQPTADAVSQFRSCHRLGERKPIIGLGVRLAAEKGIEYLLQAMPKILAKYPDAMILHAGPREAIGEAAYLAKLKPLLEQYGEHYLHVGTLDPYQMSLFFSACDISVLPSINSTETFGLVQIESMMCGTPVVASDLPGVRQPTMMTGMGRTVPIKDSPALADAILDVLDNKQKYFRPRDQIASMFSPDSLAQKYEALFEELLRKRVGRKVNK
ncbi:MAG: glycosyltransferase family 4 protein [Chloroflexota bacterium]